MLLDTNIVSYIYKGYSRAVSYERHLLGGQCYVFLQSPRSSTATCEFVTACRHSSTHPHKFIATQARTRRNLPDRLWRPSESEYEKTPTPQCTVSTIVYLLSYFPVLVNWISMN